MRKLSILLLIGLMMVLANAGPNFIQRQRRTTPTKTTTTKTTTKKSINSEESNESGSEESKESGSEESNESGSEERTTTKVALTTTPIHCPTDYEYLFGKCYKFNSTTLDEVAAQSDCIQSGGDLISINTADEVNYVNSKSQNGVWVGAVVLSDGKFVWFDLSTNITANWCAGYPNNLATNNSVIVVGNCYQNVDTGSQYGFICQADPIA